MNLLKDSVLILTIITAALYSIGTAHFNGTLLELNINPYLIERNFHQILYYGAITAMKPVIPKLVFVSASIIFLELLKTLFRKEYTKFSTWMLNTLNHNITYDLTAFTFEGLSKVILSVCFFLILIVYSLSYFESKGKDQAVDYLADINNNNIETVTIKLDGKEKTVFKLTCGNQYCVSYEKETNHIIYYHKKAIVFTVNK